MDIEAKEKIGYLERMVGAHEVRIQELEKLYASIVNRLTKAEAAASDAKPQRPPSDDPV